MHKTPEHLKQYGIARQSGQTRAIPRVLLAYIGPGKSRLLKTMLASIMAGALPEYGQKRTWRRDVTQLSLAGMCGVARETFTRWMSEVATPDDSWTVPRRLQQRDRARQHHQIRGHRLHEQDRPVRGHVSTLIARRRRFMRPNSYSPVLPEPRNQRSNEKWYPPSLQELASSANTSGLFRPLEDGEQGYRGFGQVPQWVWDPKLPIGGNARLVMSYYFMIGLLRPRNGNVVGVVRPRQAVVARALGISVRSVYKSNAELAAVGLIRVAHSKPEVQSDGSIHRGPQIIIYLPLRQLTREEAADERHRLLRALGALRAFPAPWMAPRVKELHHALLSEWEGQEHCLGAFWNELRRRAIAEGVHKSSILDRLIPQPPE